MARTDLSLAELVEYRPAAAEPSDFDTFWADTLETTAGIDLAVRRPHHDPLPDRRYLRRNGYCRHGDHELKE